MIHFNNWNWLYWGRSYDWETRLRLQGNVIHSVVVCWLCRCNRVDSGMSSLDDRHGSMASRGGH